MLSKFSVLLSVYSKESPKFLRGALDSVFEQDLKPNEVVLVKDGKLTTDLENVISEFSDRYDTLKLVPLTENVGLGIALQKGLESCSFEHVIRMDTDDVCRKDRFKTQMEYFSNNLEIDVLGSNIAEFLSNPIDTVSERKVPEENDSIYHFAKKRNPMNHMSVAYKKSKVLAAGGYQPVNGFEDYYLWVRMLMAGYKFYNIQENLINARIGNDMIGRRQGLGYVKQEVNLFLNFKKMGFLSFTEFCTVIPMRVGIRILPKSTLGFIYKKILR